MDELIQQLMKHTGMTKEQALGAVEIVARHLKSRLPAPIAAQVDAALVGEHDDMIKGAQQALGDLFGRT